MKRSTYLILFGLALLVGAGVVALQPHPGYMDAQYYYAGALRLAAGQGFTEPYVWNYLGDLGELPQPSHGYWMPLTSLVALLGLKLAPFLAAFTAARIGILLVMALIAPLTAALTFQLNKRRDLALIAGLLAVFSGLYLPFLTTTDAFGIYMLLGAGFFLLLGRDDVFLKSNWHVLGLGALAGLFHLARADGGLWLGVALAAIALKWLVSEGGRGAKFRQLLVGSVLVGVGYGVVMGPWLLRNLNVFGTLLAPGGSRALWVLNYDELFIYPPERLTMARWWESGLGVILAARWEAFKVNFGTLIGVEGYVFLFPLLLAGAWVERTDRRVQIGALAYGLTFAVMTLVFPYSGGRGGLFHSGAALQPLLLALAVIGLDHALGWMGQKRGWNVRQARVVFGSALVVFAAALSGYAVVNQVLPECTEMQGSYQDFEAALIEFGAGPEDVVIVNNPPGYYLATGRSAIVIPYGSPEDLLELAERYHAEYLILEIPQPGLEELYTDPGDREGYAYLGEVGMAHIYRVDAE
ncbi:MAG: hypothetical protein JXB38_00550 [Anaerolineales bacterium]|nr:hypothetical protein [Anaerolineales bacterium]